MTTQKYLIITDERTGCTQFTNYFRFFGLRVAHDPQTSFLSKTPNKIMYNGLDEYLEKIGQDVNTVTFEDMLPFLYTRFDVLKICLISFDIETYKRIIRQCEQMNVIFLVVYRNPQSRALSKVISLNLNRQIRAQKKETTGKSTGYSNAVYDFYQPFTVDVESYIEHVYAFMKKFHTILDFLETQHIQYCFIDIGIFHKNMNASTFSTLCSKLSLKFDQNIFEKLRDKVVNFQPVDKKKYVLNRDEIETVNKTIHIKEIPLLRQNVLHVFM